MPLNQKFETFIFYANTVIENSINNKDFKNSISVYGYNEEKIKEGKILLINLLNLQKIQIEKHKQQYKTTAIYKEKWENAKKNYMKIVKITRIALETKKNFRKLNLEEKRERVFSKWYNQAVIFYNTILTDNLILEKLNNYNINKTILLNSLNKIEEVKKINSLLKDKKEEAKESTTERDKSIETLQKWLRNFTNIAKIALQDKPELLKIVKIKNN